MQRINLVVEGQTEETFVRDVLALHLANLGVYLSARRVITGRDGYKIFRGGMTSYEKAKRDIQLWLKQDKKAYVSTMFDLYALPEDFPGYTDSKNIQNPYLRVNQIEMALKADIGEHRFLPYVQLHEFEALLFSDINALDESLRIFSWSHLNELAQIKANFSNPELINDGETTAPSKRLKGIYGSIYDKVAFGSIIANRIGVGTLRQECSHFDAWLKTMEALADH